jgi:hypothetical protein
MSGHLPKRPESWAADGKTDKMIGGQENGRPPWHALIRPAVSRRARLSTPPRAVAAPINPQNPTPNNVQNDTQGRSCPGGTKWLAVILVGNNRLASHGSRREFYANGGLHEYTAQNRFAGAIMGGPLWMGGSGP